MNSQANKLHRVVALLMGGAIALAGTQLRADNSDAMPKFESYIKISGKAPSVSGNDSSFARRFQIPANGAYGIEALHVYKDTSDNTSMTFDGKALVGSEDYLGKVKLAKNEVGTFEMGYKRFRTFYDGIGGFFPLNKAWMPLADSELHTDRAKFWAEAKIEMPNAPKFEFRYTNEQRTGMKDSTIWGDTDFTGIPAYYGVGATAITPGTSVYPYSTNRKIVPATINLNERQQNWFGSVKHTIGDTEVEFEINHNSATSGDVRSVIRYPGELQLYPRQSSLTNPPQIYPPATIGNMVRGYDKQMFDGTITSYVGKFETKFTDQVTVYGGLLYSTGSANIGGDRQMTQYMPTAVGQVTAIGGFVGSSGRPPYSYTTVAGETNEKVKAANLGIRIHPTSDFTGRFAIKYEKADVDGYNTTNYTSNSINQTTGVVTPVLVTAPNLADRTEKTWFPEAELRYTPTKDIALYSSFEYRRSPGDEFGSSTGVGTGGIISGPTVSNDSIKLKHKHYKVGANWTVSPIVSLRGEVFYKDHTNGFYSTTTVGDSFVMGYQFTGTKITAIVKPQSNLTFTSRYIQQSGKMDTTIDGANNYQSNDAKNYSFGETVDWAPTAQFYCQANLNVVYNTIQTAYPRAGGKANNALRNADNNYMNGSLIAGFAVDKETDAQLEYTYYRADNYSAPTIATVFYGAGVKESTLAVALKRKISDRIIGNLKIGYFDVQCETTGGNTNFKGPMAYVSLDHAL